ncbi:hypothetical protein EV127DRAFT_228720 [Xylaria flabelliformis]|nr:hypothetical protein EV127DRAFT_228720 [Xylaria flabelliformis]
MSQILDSGESLLPKPDCLVYFGIIKYWNTAFLEHNFLGFLERFFGIETMPIFNLAYKGSSHHRPRFNYPSPTDAGGTHPERPTDQTSQLPLPQSSTTARHQKQRRISRNQHGLHVSRRLPARTSRGSLPAADNESPLSQTTRSPEHPYWGTLQSPSASCRNSRASRIVDNRPTDIPSNEPINSGPAEDKVRSEIEGGPVVIDPRKRGRKTPRREKRFGVADPLAWDIINRSLTQQHRLSSLVGTDNPIALPVKESSKRGVNVLSRTSSQRRALNKFARELEKYADVAGAAGKAPVITPTISDSKASIHTVKPLVPYKDEFLAAGLAVTSAEQSRSLTNKAHAQASLQRDRLHEHPNEPIHASKKLDTPGNGTSSSTSFSPSCTSSGSYVEFSPPSMLHAIESLVPRKANTKLKHRQHARKHLLSWFLKKPSGKSGSGVGRPLPVGIQHVKGGQIKPNDLSSQHEHRRLQHRSHRPTMQSIPEIQLWPKKPVPPPKLVTPKKEPCVALATDYCEQSDRGPHPSQEGEHHGSIIDAKRSLGAASLRGKRDITRGVLPKPYPEFIGTIEEETNRNTHSVGTSNQDRYPPRTNHKMMPSVKQGTRQRPDVKSSMTQESSVPSLPFAARLAASTSSSLQRALDDACRKLDDEDLLADNVSKHGNNKQDLPPIPRQDSHQNVSCRALPRKPRSTDKFIYVKRTMPKVEVGQTASKPLPPEPLLPVPVTPEKASGSRPRQPSRKAPPISPVPRPLTGKRKNAVAELAKAEEMLKDLDVFLNDYDDANIEDRDVIKGLQVAIHAAADDLYDGYIRHKTGLRIRRFLADLKSFEDISDLGSTDQRAREKRAKSRKLEGRDRNNRRA